MTRLIIQTCGPSTSLQDHGRFGWQKYGLGPAGAMDRLAQAEANALVGNVAGAGVIELAIAGMRFTIEDGAARIALAGAEQKLTVDGVAVPPAAAVTVQAGQVVDISGVKVGRFGYLAVAGGFDVPLQLGALAYHSRALMGGFNGRTLQAGDALALRLPTPPSRPDLMAPGGFVRRPKGRLRVVAGPQDDYFGEVGHVSWRGLYDHGECGSHGSAADGTRDRAQCARLQHRLGRDRHWLDPGAGLGRAADPAGGSADDRRLSKDRDGDHGRLAAPRTVRPRLPTPL
jgi:hypothetical protein